MTYPNRNDGVLRMATYVGLILSCMSVAYVSAPAFAQDAAAEAGAAAARCRAWFASVSSPRELQANAGALDDVKRCIALGVDPPLAIREDNGRGSRVTSGGGDITGRICPPFSTCMYKSRLSRSPTGVLNPTYGGLSSGANRVNEPQQDIFSSYSAPQFIGHTPTTMPAHLEGGGTVYFYEPTRISTGIGSLVWPANSINYFTDTSTVDVPISHVTALPAPGGVLVNGIPVTLQADVRLNFHDGTVIQMPPSYVSRIVDGTPINAGDYVRIDHTEQLMLPAQTKIYLYPENSSPSYAHAGPDAPPPYSGPPLQYPVPMKKIITDPAIVVY